MATGLQNKQEVFKGIFNLENNINPGLLGSDISQTNSKYIIVKKDLVNILSVNQIIKYDRYYDYFKSNSNFSLMENNSYFFFI